MAQPQISFRHYLNLLAQHRKANGQYRCCWWQSVSSFADAHIAAVGIRYENGEEASILCCAHAAIGGSLVPAWMSSQVRPHLAHVASDNILYCSEQLLIVTRSTCKGIISCKTKSNSLATACMPEPCRPCKHVLQILSASLALTTCGNEQKDVVCEHSSPHA